MGRGLDKDTAGGPVSRKNKKNPYTLSETEIENIQIVKDAFANDKKIFHNIVSEEKEPGRIRRAFSAFWREIAGQKKLPYKEIDVKDFAKDMEIYTKEPGVFNISGLDEYKNSDENKELLEKVQKQLVDKKTNDDFHAVFLEHIKKKEDKNTLQEWGKEAVQFDWNFADGDETFKIEPGSWSEGGSKNDYRLDKDEAQVLKRVSAALENGQGSFANIIGDGDDADEKAEQKKAFWREMAAQKKLPFVEVSFRESNTWLSPAEPFTSWRQQLQNPGIFNIEIDDVTNLDYFIDFTNALSSGHGKIHKDAIVNIIDRRSEYSRSHSPASVYDRIMTLE